MKNNTDSQAANDSQAKDVQHDEVLSRKDKKHLKKIEKELEDIQAQLEAVTAEKDELLAKYQRLSADYTNYQKRVPKQIAETVGYRTESFIKAMLPSLDNFDHALASSQNAQDAQSVLDGLKIVYDHFLDALKGQGVVQVDSAGQPFDPNTHQAMMRQSDASQPDGVVLQEMQKAYKLNDKVIRPAAVIVNKIETPAEETEETQQEDQNNQ